MLGREQFVPQRIKLLQGGAGIRLGDVSILRPGRLPCPRENLGLTEHGAQLVDDRGLDLTRRHAAHGARSGAMLQHGLADVVTVQPPALAGMGRRERGALGTEQQPFQQRRNIGARMRVDGSPMRC